MPQSEFSQTASSNQPSDVNSSKVVTLPSKIQSEYSQALTKVRVVDQDCIDRTPGPYILPPLIGYKNHDVTKTRAPAFTIAVKRPKPMPDAAIPGPVYKTTGLTHYGKANAPKAMIRSRPPVTSVYSDLGPGPGFYSPEKHLNAIFPRAPSAALQGLKRPPMFEESPGPTFDPEKVLGSRLPIKPSAPVATVRGIKPILSIYSDSGPAPGHYNVVPVHKMMSRAPSATIGSKWPGKSVYEYDGIPAPNAYNPNVDNFGPRPPKAFLGIKHSMCKASVKVPEDTYSIAEF